MRFGTRRHHKADPGRRAGSGFCVRDRFDRLIRHIRGEARGRSRTVPRRPPPRRRGIRRAARRPRLDGFLKPDTGHVLAEQAVAANLADVGQRLGLAVVHKRHQAGGLCAPLTAQFRDGLGREERLGSPAVSGKKCRGSAISTRGPSAESCSVHCPGDRQHVLMGRLVHD